LRDDRLWPDFAPLPRLIAYGPRTLATINKLVGDANPCSDRTLDGTNVGRSALAGPVVMGENQIVYARITKSPGRAQ